MIDCCLTSTGQYFISVRERGTLNEMMKSTFVLDKYAKLDLYSASSLKQQHMGIRHISPI